MRRRIIAGRTGRRGGTGPTSGRTGRPDIPGLFRALYGIRRWPGRFRAGEEYREGPSGFPDGMCIREVAGPGRNSGRNRARFELAGHTHVTRPVPGRGKAALEKWNNCPNFAFRNRVP